MLYDLTLPLEVERFRTRAAHLEGKGALVELTERTQRTTSQNAYLHLLLGVVAMETGTDLAYCKEVYFKRLVNPETFVIRKSDRLAGDVETLRSTAALSKEELSTCIDRFKRWGAENGIYLPNPGDESLLRDIERQMARNAQYL